MQPGNGFHREDGFAHDLADGHGLGVDLETTALNAGGFDQIVDQGLKIDDPDIDRVEQFFDFRRGEIRELIYQQLHGSRECGQGVRNS